MAEWTEERRQKHREMLQKLRPWEKSTGPKTLMGKRRSSTNAFKTGIHTFKGRLLKQMLEINEKDLKNIRLSDGLEAIKNELLKHRAKSGQ